MKIARLLPAMVFLSGCVSSKRPDPAVQNLIAAFESLADKLPAALFEATYKTTYRVMTVVQSEFALKLFVAKLDRVPTSMDELNNFLSQNQIPMALEPSLQLNANISQGHCEYAVKDGTGTWSGSFEVTGLDYDKTLQSYMALKAHMEKMSEALLGASAGTSSGLAPAAPAR